MGHGACCRCRLGNEPSLPKALIWSGGGAAKAEAIDSYRQGILLFKILLHRRARPWPVSEAKQCAQDMPLAPAGMAWLILWGTMDRF